MKPTTRLFVPKAPPRPHEEPVSEHTGHEQDPCPRTAPANHGSARHQQAAGNAGAPRATRSEAWTHSATARFGSAPPTGTRSVRRALPLPVLHPRPVCNAWPTPRARSATRPCASAEARRAVCDAATESRSHGAEPIPRPGNRPRRLRVPESFRRETRQAHVGRRPRGCPEHGLDFENAPLVSIHCGPPVQNGKAA